MKLLALILGLSLVSIAHSGKLTPKERIKITKEVSAPYNEKLAAVQKEKKEKLAALKRHKQRKLAEIQKEMVPEMAKFVDPETGKAKENIDVAEAMKAAQAMSAKINPNSPEFRNKVNKSEHKKEKVEAWYRKKKRAIYKKYDAKETKLMNASTAAVWRALNKAKEGQSP